MKRTKILIAAVLLFVPFNMAFPKNFPPKCRIRFDNAPSGSLALTGTTDQINVIVGYKNGSVDSGPLDMTGVAENHDIWIHPVCSDIDYVFLETFGYDWLWIDQVELHGYNSSGVLTPFATFGVDNTQGWCLSIDPSDGNNTVCEPDGSYVDRAWELP